MVARVQFMVPCGFLVLDFGLERHSFSWPTSAGQHASLILVWTNVPHGNRHRKHFLISISGCVCPAVTRCRRECPIEQPDEVNGRRVMFRRATNLGPCFSVWGSCCTALIGCRTEVRIERPDEVFCLPKTLSALVLTGMNSSLRD